MKIIRQTSFILLFIVALTGCFSLPENHLSVYQRSVVIDNETTLKTILSKARIEQTNDPALNNLQILYVKGTPYEMGFQHGRLLKDEVRACVYSVMRKIRFFATEEMLDEVYDLMAPFIPVEEQDEMRGLAHGAEIPLRLIHWFHALPEATEYKGRRQFTKKFKGTSCSNVAAFGKATEDGGLYQLRVLDWNRKLGVQKWPVIIVHQPESGYSSVSFSYAGFVGCVTGMNSEKIALGEMGYGSPPNETLEGTPFIFLFRQLLRSASSLKEVNKQIKDSRRTCSYIFLASDGKIKENQAVLIVANKDTVQTFIENQRLTDYRNGETLPPMENIVYAGAKKKALIKSLQDFYGSLSVVTLKEVARQASMKSNVQNVIFKPATLETWVSNAADTGKSITGKACNQKWFYFNFGGKR